LPSTTSWCQQPAGASNADCPGEAVTSQRSATSGPCDWQGPASRLGEMGGRLSGSPCNVLQGFPAIFSGHDLIVSPVRQGLRLNWVHSREDARSLRHGQQRGAARRGGSRDRSRPKGVGHALGVDGAGVLRGWLPGSHRVGSSLLGDGGGAVRPVRPGRPRPCAACGGSGAVLTPWGWVCPFCIRKVKP